MTKFPFSSLAFAAMFGTTAAFAGTLAENVTPARAQSTHSAFYLSAGLALTLGFDKNNLPTVDISVADVDPRLIKSADTAYALIERKTALEMIENMKGQVGRADKDTMLIDDAGYGIVMLDAETLRADSAYAELIDDEIKDDAVLIMVLGPAAAQVLRGLDIDPDSIVTGDDAIDVVETFTDFTLGLGATDDGGHMPGTGMSSTLGAAAPELADS